MGFVSNAAIILQDCLCTVGENPSEYLDGLTKALPPRRPIVQLMGTKRLS